MSDIDILIRESFQKYKIGGLQFDPNGLCNAGCWFCPVKYLGNPEEAKGNMSVELMEKIFDNLISERDPGGLVDPKFHHFYTAHYNEILLYKHFEDLLKICRKHKLRFMVLSNGTPLTPQKTDLLISYPDVISGVCLNIPCFEPELWAKRVNLSSKLFDKLISNIRYFIDNNKMQISIQVNGWHSSHDWLDKGPNFPSDLEDEENQKQLEIAKKLFPEANVFKCFQLIDRAGYLSDVITNKNAIKKRFGDKRVVSCGNSWEMGGRPIGWVHVNANGECFLCCNDYKMEIKFGDFKTQELKDFWGKEDHINKIKNSYETICKECASARFE